MQLSLQTQNGNQSGSVAVLKSWIINAIITSNSWSSVRGCVSGFTSRGPGLRLIIFIVFAFTTLKGFPFLSRKFALQIEIESLQLLTAVKDQSARI